MKKLVTIISILALTVWLSGCSDNSPPEDLSKIEALKSKDPSRINQVRLTILKQTSRGLGAQAGLAWRSKPLNAILDKQKSQLDHIFNFNYITLNHNVLPPVLAEGRDTLNQSDDYTIRAADRYYQIVYPPRFITAPPTWRDYIWMSYKKPEVPNSSLLPKNSDERSIWNTYVQIGWNEGVIQSDEIFIANLNRLKRDYEGMLLYRKLLAQNMVTAPFVSEAQMGVTGGGGDMRVNDRILRIVSTSELKSDAKTWNPVVSEKKNNYNPRYQSNPKCVSGASNQDKL